MTAAILDIHIEQGATYELNCTMRDSDNQTVDLTSWTFSGKIKESLNQTVAIANFTFTKANQTTSTGQFTISLSSVITAAIPTNTVVSGGNRPSTTYFYDIEAIKPNGNTDRIFQGRAFVSPEVTR